MSQDHVSGASQTRGSALWIMLRCWMGTHVRGFLPARYLSVMPSNSLRHASSMAGSVHTTDLDHTTQKGRMWLRLGKARTSCEGQGE